MLFRSVDDELIKYRPKFRELIEDSEIIHVKLGDVKLPYRGAGERRGRLAIHLVQEILEIEAVEI